ncbi:cation:proton antiporter [Euhalothece natronophila Z-M001]|uniref:Cation:proton antiporter n=1 Tax=Euhalothece natronophila Z-M001 TaxID=522448 RepID=A0A5B8NQF4_9CHRO|nr:Na+/H+ antiporter subunit E [Euhalothece natronophila]QDZ40781.1 cation:proton antiporter [Euhalothece natronophila Z-M001]
MIESFNFVLRLAIWFLLTAELSAINILFGVAVALLLPQPRRRRVMIRDWLKVLGEIAIAIPKAYIEAFELILFPHTQEEITMERVKPNRTPGLIFLDIFLITFTPKTIVSQYHQRGWYEVHRVKRKTRK